MDIYSHLMKKMALYPQSKSPKLSNVKTSKNIAIKLKYQRYQHWKYFKNPPRKNDAIMLMNNSPIQMEWFYYIEGEKTKFNWFLLEVALEYYSQIMRSTELETYRKQHSNKHIALYCTYYARRSKEDLLKVVKGRRKRMQVYEEYIFDYYPQQIRAV